MLINILTLFPEMFEGVLNHSILKRAQDQNIFEAQLVNFRQFARNKQKHVDDYPYGGGAGMLLMVEPMVLALESVGVVAEGGRHLKERPGVKQAVILLDPAGKTFTQAEAETLAQYDELTFVCGHYEGYDERIKPYITHEYSLGDFVLTGGELACLTMIDAVVRLIPGALGNQNSALDDSHSTGLLEYPQYTRPQSFRQYDVPEVLLSGHHAKIEAWRRQESLKITYAKRPDMLAKARLTPQDQAYLKNLARTNGLEAIQE